MNRLSLIPLAAIAACSGAPVIQQSAPTTPETDPQTEAEVMTALETAELIKDRCIGLLSDGEISFGVEETGEQVETTLEVTKGYQDEDTITEETCKCIYRIHIPTFVNEKRSCEYSYDKRGVKDGELEREQIGINTVAHTEKPDGRSFTRSSTTTIATDREPITVKSRFTTEISADRSGCRTSNEDTTPYDPAKLASCEYFADQVSISANVVKGAICRQICRQLESNQWRWSGGTNNPPPLCSGERVYDSAR